MALLELRRQPLARPLDQDGSKQLLSAGIAVDVLLLQIFPGSVQRQRDLSMIRVSGQWGSCRFPFFARGRYLLPRHFFQKDDLRAIGQQKLDT